MQNPFTTTFSKAPEAYIETNTIHEIIDNFSYDNPTESVYKITGVRGSGKTVLLAKIIEELRNGEEWIIYTLSSSRDLLSQLCASLYKDGYIKVKNKENSVGLNISVMGTGGGMTLSRNKEDYIHDVGTEIEEGIKNIQKKHLKLFIGIDEVHKSKEMTEFASEFGKWLILQYPVYLVCTGLYENINQLSNVKNLTFLRRATTIETESLNRIRMIEMYKNKLSISHDIAIRLADATKGYAYAFQKLGNLYFSKKDSDTVDSLLLLLKSDLFAYSYEKIWEELSPKDQAFMKLLIEQDKTPRSYIINKIGNEYSVYRDRLIKKGLIDIEGHYIYLSLPFFTNYIKEYCL